MRPKPGDSMQKQLKSFVELLSELAVTGDAINEEDKVIYIYIYLLAALPDTFCTLVTALEAIE